MVPNGARSARSTASASATVRFATRKEWPEVAGIARLNRDDRRAHEAFEKLFDGRVQQAVLESNRRLRRQRLDERLRAPPSTGSRLARSSPPNPAAPAAPRLALINCKTPTMCPCGVRIGAANTDLVGTRPSRRSWGSNV